ncbi:hypothetical protein [Haloferula sp. A504]|uniref:hypothetical protein n=1 Tax=Haloferula sp. A504 TaxID=3373601 RepID=UPI0031C219B7|nr:hypothetical protein [Verrucomicrobiaceae bacterium E54]
MPPPERRHLAQWLRRARKQLAPSGRLSEVALLLSRKDGGSPEWHAERLRAILEGHVVPTLDEVTALDSLVARPRNIPASVAEPPSLF